MTKLRDFMQKPIAWGQYTKLSIICMVLSLLSTAIYLMKIFGIFELIGEKVESGVEKVKKFFGKEYIESNRN